MLIWTRFMLCRVGLIGHSAPHKALTCSMKRSKAGAMLKTFQCQPETVIPSTQHLAPQGYGITASLVNSLHTT